MMIENLIHEILGENTPVMTSNNDIIATFQYVLYLCCTERERNFLFKYYGENMTYCQIAIEESLSEETIRQTVKESLQKLNGYRDILRCGLKEWHFSKIRELEASCQKSETVPDKLEILNLSTRTYHILKRAGIRSLTELTELTVRELSSRRYIGQKTIDEIVDAVHSCGLKMADESKVFIYE